jgi:hypothetical protein
MSSPWSLAHYSERRDKDYYIGLVLISTNSLHIDTTLQRTFDEGHAVNIMPMYSQDVDLRGADPLECVVLLKDREKVDKWVKDQDTSKLTQTQPEHMLVLPILDCSFLIIKGQHQYKAYCKVMEAGELPKDAPHPGHLPVKLYHSGVLLLLHNFSVILIILSRSY